MVSNVALLAAAFGVVQVAGSLGSPLKELVLIGVCIGALLASSVMQQADKTPGAGPVLPQGWRYRRRGRGGAEHAPGAEAAEGHGSVPGDGTGVGNTAPGQALEVLAYPAELLEEDGGVDRKSQEALAVAIVPGNPGIPHFYCDFAERLQHELSEASPKRKVVIYVVGYPNWVTQGTPEEVGAHVDDEAAAISQVLAELEQEHVRGGFVPFGHSIGGWVVAQHLLRRQLQQPDGRDKGKAGVAGGASPYIPMMVLAMPYLEFYGSWKQRLVSFVSSLPGFRQLVRFIALTLLALPQSLHDPAGRLLVSESQAHIDIAKATLLQQAHHLEGMLLMVKSEVQRLRPPSSAPPGEAAEQAAGFEELRPLLGSKDRPAVLALFTSGDVWSPECHAPKLHAMLSEVPGDEVLDLGQPTEGFERPPDHGFVLERHSIGPVARLVAARLLAVLEASNLGSAQKAKQ